MPLEQCFHLRLKPHPELVPVTLVLSMDAQPKITQELTELTGFVEDMRALGRTPTARLLDKRVVAADEAVAHQLALAPGTLVVRLRRVRLADGVAMSFDETYLPREIGGKVAADDLDAEPVFAL